jgi:hypothetical protein
MSVSVRVGAPPFGAPPFGPPPPPTPESLRPEQYTRAQLKEFAQRAFDVAHANFEIPNGSAEEVWDERDERADTARSNYIRDAHARVKTMPAGEAQAFYESWHADLRTKFNTFTQPLQLGTTKTSWEQFSGFKLENVNARSVKSVSNLLTKLKPDFLKNKTAKEGTLFIIGCDEGYFADPANVPTWVPALTAHFSYVEAKSELVIFYDASKNPLLKCIPRNQKYVRELGAQHRMRFLKVNPELNPALYETSFYDYTAGYIMA